MTQTDTGEPYSHSRNTINNLYDSQSGADAQLQAIIIFGKYWWVFALIGIVISIFSIQLDLKEQFGTLGAIAVALFFATTIEAFKAGAIKGAFADFSIVWKGVLGAIAVGLFVFNVVTHYKSLLVAIETDKKVAKADTNNDINDRIKALQLENKSLIGQNANYAKILDNGYSGDDAIASHGLLKLNESYSKNQAAIANLELTRSQSVKEAVSEAQSSGETRLNVLTLLFAMFEFFAISSILSKMLIRDATSSSHREYTEKNKKIEQLENIIYTTILDGKIEVTEQKLLEKLQEKKDKKPPTPPYDDSSSNQGVVVDESGSLGRTEPEPTHKATHKTTVTVDVDGGTYEYETEEVIGEGDCMNADMDEEIARNASKIRTINPSNFTDSEQKLIQVLWKHGNVKVGQFLTSRTKVLEELGTAEGRSGQLTALYFKLEKELKSIKSIAGQGKEALAELPRVENLIEQGA